MEWVGECEQTTLAMANTIDQQTQQLQTHHDSIQQDLRQELQKHHTNILQDVQFQLNLLAETFKQIRLCIYNITRPNDHLGSGSPINAELDLVNSIGIAASNKTSFGIMLENGNSNTSLCQMNLQCRI